MSVSPTREQVFSALFAQLQTIGLTIKTYSRRMMQYSSVGPSLLPILMLWEQPEETIWHAQGLPIDIWEAAIVIVFQNPPQPEGGDPTTATAGATIINPLIDAVRGALQPDETATGNFTLGGLVEWCRVEGKTIVETGDTDPQGWGGAVIPVRILVPSQGNV